jgi:hypothetical protein
LQTQRAKNLVHDGMRITIAGVKTAGTAAALKRPSSGPPALLRFPQALQRRG